MNHYIVSKKTFWSAVFFVTIILFHIGHLITLGAYGSFFGYISYQVVTGLLYIVSWVGLAFNLITGRKQKN
jgi:hypothetical protein